MKLALPAQFKFSGLSARAMPAIGAPIMVLAALAMVVLPILPFFSISFLVLILLCRWWYFCYRLYQRPLDFAAFPTVLLIATLLRLALNVASTRVVLLNGHNGDDAVGEVIAAFGEVVIGGNYVGLVVS